MVADSEKTPWRVAAGAKGASIRWGPPRVVRLDGLDAPYRRLVLAMIDAAKAAAASEPGKV